MVRQGTGSASQVPPVSWALLTMTGTLNLETGEKHHTRIPGREATDFGVERLDPDLVIWEQLKLSRALVYLVSRAKLKGTSWVRTERPYCVKKHQCIQDERSSLRPAVALSSTGSDSSHSQPASLPHILSFASPRLDTVISCL